MRNHQRIETPTPEPQLYLALLAVFVCSIVFFYCSSPPLEFNEGEVLLATPIMYQGTKVGPPFDIVSTNPIPDALEAYYKLEQLIPGDGSGIGTLDGDPVFELDETATRDDSCQCTWVQSNVAANPFVLPMKDKNGLATGAKHGICSITRTGRVYYGDFDVRTKKCAVNVDDERIDAAAFRYLTGNCDLPLETRGLCTASQENMLSFASIGVCMNNETFGYTALRNGRIACFTAPSSGAAVMQSCSGFSYIPIGGAYCLPPSIRA